MSQQIQASTPSPVSPAAAPAVSSDQGSTTAYPQWVAQGATPAVASVPTAQAPSAGGTGFGPFYQQPVQPVNVAILPEQPLGSSDGFPGAGDQQPAFAVPQPGSTVTTDPGSAAGYNTSESAFTGPALGLPGAAGSADLAYQRLTDPDFLAGFYGQQPA